MPRKLAPALTLSMTLSLALLTPALPATAGGEDHHSPFEGMPLLTLMHNLQYYGHKLGLAIDAGNVKLQGFYVHEVEEVIEALGDIKDYDGIPIGQNLADTLKPAFEHLEGAIELGEPKAIDTAYDGLIQGCNACHQASGRGYLVIKRNPDNPYPQDFSAAN
jgi:hypothetical protein